MKVPYKSGIIKIFLKKPQNELLKLAEWIATAGKWCTDVSLVRGA